VKNKVTGHTRGFGFVRFYGMSDVYRALSLPESELPTYTDRVTGKVATVKVSYADPKNVVYIANIPRDMSYDLIVKIVNEMTNIPLIRFDLSGYKADDRIRGHDDDEDDRHHREEESRGSSGLHDGYGWLTYPSHESAINALKTLQRNLFNDSIQLEASFAEPRIFDKQAFESSTTLKVSRVELSLSDEALLNMFNSGTGEKQLAIRVDPIDSESDIHQSAERNPDTRTVIVDCVSHEDADALRSRFNGYELNRNAIVVEWYIPPAELKRPQKLSKPAEVHAAAQGYRVNYGPPSGSHYHQGYRHPRGSYHQAPGRCPPRNYDAPPHYSGPPRPYYAGGPSYDYPPSGRYNNEPPMRYPPRRPMRSSDHHPPSGRHAISGADYYDRAAYEDFNPPGPAHSSHAPASPPSHYHSGGYPSGDSRRPPPSSSSYPYPSPTHAGHYYDDDRQGYAASYSGRNSGPPHRRSHYDSYPPQTHIYDSGPPVRTSSSSRRPYTGDRRRRSLSPVSPTRSDASAPPSSRGGYPPNKRQRY